MRIALVTYTFSATRGGVERVVWNLARGVAARGHEVHVVCHRAEAEAEPGVTVHAVPVLAWHSALRYATFASNAAAAVDALGVDVAQGFGRTIRQDIVRVGGGSHWEYLLHTKPSMRTPLGRLLRRMNPRDATILALERRCFAPGSYRKVLCVSRRVRDEVRRYFGVPDEALVVLHNGVDVRRFAPSVRSERRRPERERLGLSDRDVALLFAGTGFDRKGLAYAVEAAALVAKDAPVRLLVAGRGAEGPHLRRARSLGFASGLRFLGETEDIAGLYAAADAFVLPTLYDPFPNACLEAMACGVPVVTTAVTGVAEIIASGVDSYVVPSGDSVLEIAAALRALLDPVRREATGRAARATAERHSLEAYLDRTVALYTEVAELKRAGAPAAPALRASPRSCCP